jgi:hypothetical protein
MLLTQAIADECDAVPLLSGATEVRSELKQLIE